MVRVPAVPCAVAQHLVQRCFRGLTPDHDANLEAHACPDQLSPLAVTVGPINRATGWRTWCTCKEDSGSTMKSSALASSSTLQRLANRKKVVMGSSAERVCTWRKYAVSLSQRGHAAFVDSTLRQAFSPPRTSSACFRSVGTSNATAVPSSG